MQMLRQVVRGLKMTPVFESVSTPFTAELMGEDGTVEASEAMEDAARAMLDELQRVEETLRPLRNEIRFAVRAA